MYMLWNKKTRFVIDYVEFCLWKWDGLFIADKYKYNHGLDKRKIEIWSGR